MAIECVDYTTVLSSSLALLAAPWIRLAEEEEQEMFRRELDVDDDAEDDPA